MIELALIFVAGLLGSSHCLGMCGPFALALGSGSTSWRGNLLRQGIYSTGRIFTYSVLGLFVGFGSWRLQAEFAWLAQLPALLAIAAGLLLLWQGLATAGWLPAQTVATNQGGVCLGGTFFASFLTAPRSTDVFLAGMFTGFLPCGLVYAFLALAASHGNPWQGAAAMAAFGAGTVPLMVLTGAGGSLVSLAIRQRLLHFAAWCVVVTGAISILRGLGFVHVPGLLESPGCPLCFGS